VGPKTTVDITIRRKHNASEAREFAYTPATDVRDSLLHYEM